MKDPQLLLTFHQNEQEWNNLYNKLFFSPTTQHMDSIQIQQMNSIKSFPAFYYYTETTAYLLSDIIEQMSRLNNVVNKIPASAIEQFQISCLIEEIQSSNDIEGVHSTRREISEALDEQDTQEGPGKIRLWGIVNKYIKLLGNENIAFYTCDDLRKFYDDFVLDEVCRDDEKNRPDGEIFRADGVDVHSNTKIIHKGLYPESKIISYMEQAMQILHDTQIPALIRISIFHYLFGYIHPFYDGNGRTSRFITSYYLSKILNPLVGIRLSITTKKSLRAYYKLFEITDAYGTRGDLTPFITGFLRIIRKSIIRVNDLLEEKQRELERYQELLKQIPLKDHVSEMICLQLLQAALFSADGVTLSALESPIDKTSRTIREKILSLPEGLVLTNKTRRAHRYILNLKYFDKKCSSI